MHATAVSLLALFEPKMQLEVPLFQRQYVWQREKHWEPLWEDIARKFADYLDNRKESPVHFLGAMVLDQKQTPATQVGKRVRGRLALSAGHAAPANRSRRPLWNC